MGGVKEDMLTEMTSDIMAERDRPTKRGGRRE